MVERSWRGLDGKQRRAGGTCARYRNGGAFWVRVRGGIDGICVSDNRWVGNSPWIPSVKSVWSDADNQNNDSTIIKDGGRSIRRGHPEGGAIVHR